MRSRVALVTGGTRGLGLAMSSRLCRDGFSVAMFYRGDEEAKDEALRILGSGAKVAAYRVDISNAAAVDDGVARVARELGPVGALVNNAFRSGRPPVKTHELGPDAWAEDLATNLTGHFLVTRACLPGMVEQGFGRVVFIGSLAMRGEPGRVAYSTAKSAVVGLAKTIAREYAKDGITANVVSPGFIDAGAFQRLSEEIRQRALKAVPARRAGSGDEVAALVAHLCSEESGYTTGQVIGVDGAAS